MFDLFTEAKTFFRSKIDSCVLVEPKRQRVCSTASFNSEEINVMMILKYHSKNNTILFPKFELESPSSVSKMYVFINLN